MSLASRILRPILISSTLLALVGGVIGMFYNLSLYFQIVERRSEAELQGARMTIVRHYLYGDIIGLRSNLDSIAHGNHWASARFREPSGETVWAFRQDRGPSEFSILKSVFARDKIEKEISIENSAGTELGKLDVTFNIPLERSQILKLMISFFVPFGVFFLVYLFITYRVLRKATHPLEDLTQELRSYAEELNFEVGVRGKGDQIAEIRRLFSELRFRWQEALNLALKSEAEAAKARVAAQVAHDIRSPLTALNVLRESIVSLTEDQRSLLRAAIGRITAVAENLSSTTSSRSRVMPTVIVPLVRSIIDEKKLEYVNENELEFEFRFDPLLLFVSAVCDPTDLKCMISNLINNAVQAMYGRHGAILISVGALESFCSISIEDKGQGIPEEVLAQIGQRGFSYGKKLGTGLGLWHAMTSSKSWGGSTQIFSKVGHGTKVVINLPISDMHPQWMVEKIVPSPSAPVVIIDDDPSIHSLWRSKFSSIDGGKIEVIYYRATLEADVDVGELASRKALFLVDHEFSNGSATGLEFIEVHGIAPNSVLVTSDYEKSEVIAKARLLGVKLLPKSLVQDVRVH